MIFESDIEFYLKFSFYIFLFVLNVLFVILNEILFFN